MINRSKIFTFKNIAIALGIAIFFIFDRLLKQLALKSDENFSLIKDFFYFHYVPNFYLAFSLPLQSWMIIALLTSTIAILSLYIVYALKKKRRGSLLLVIILLGALSNFYDRLHYGFVIDYLEMRYFTVFNIADVMILAGAATLIFKSLVPKESRRS